MQLLHSSIQHTRPYHIHKSIIQMTSVTFTTVNDVVILDIQRSNFDFKRRVWSLLKTEHKGGNLKGKGHCHGKFYTMLWLCFYFTNLIKKHSLFFHQSFVSYLKFSIYQTEPKWFCLSLSERINIISWNHNFSFGFRIVLISSVILMCNVPNFTILYSHCNFLQQFSRNSIHVHSARWRFISELTGRKI